MKTAMVFMLAGASMMASDFTRMKYGWTGAATTAASTGAVAIPRTEQWNRAKFGRVGATPQKPVHTAAPCCERSCCKHGA